MPILFLLFFPVLEAALTIGLFRQFGFMNVFFAWVLFTLFGVGLLRTTGVRLSVSVAQSMRSGKSPGQAALEAALVGLAGVLFVVPGFTSDAIALVLCVPFLRRMIAKRLIAKVQFSATGFQSHRDPSHQSPHPHRNDASSEIIDVEAVEVPRVSLDSPSAPPKDSTNPSKT